MKLSQSLAKFWCSLDNQKWAVICLHAWFSQLRFKHSTSTHRIILNSLEWPEVELLVSVASDGEPNFEFFANEVRRVARHANEEGLVVPDGASRGHGAGRPSKTNDTLTKDLFLIEVSL